ncbi:DNA/RNA helicase domain-containing protein [Streptomyces sp. NPDC058231]|uniref:DNA/RNA helicase domain-containing protein n=1 Tax=Streptomyces sp. NPDC058231 TaxID=3346392 RepID=UPI0036F16EF1
MELTRSFRRSGSAACTAWVHDLLYGAPVPWTGHTEYDLGLAEDPFALQERIDQATAGEHTAGATAGFCRLWPHNRPRSSRADRVPPLRLSCRAKQLRGCHDPGRARASGDLCGRGSGGRQEATEGRALLPQPSQERPQGMPTAVADRSSAGVGRPGPRVRGRRAGTGGRLSAPGRDPPGGHGGTGLRRIRRCPMW